MSAAHQIFQVNTVAIFRSAKGVPNKPAMMISKNKHTMIIFNNNKGQILLVINFTSGAIAGILAKLKLRETALIFDEIIKVRPVNKSMLMIMKMLHSRGRPGCVIVTVCHSDELYPWNYFYGHF